MRLQSRHYTNSMPVIGHKTIAAIRKLNINGHGLKWETSVGKLVIGKTGDKYIVIIGRRLYHLSIN